ncbi:MAG: LysR family transcriptional regulator [Gammaproteobacteria bacterium]|nr:MAG: LysR family transcriptional regulator [Gammaproteobacteria bacterium]
MNWDDARYFLAVAREGRMLGAAKKLGVSQALLSRHLAALEEALGVRLLDRSTRGCSLTDAGETLLVAAERMEAEMLACQAELQHAGKGVAGSVRIAAPDGFGSAFLAPRLYRFREEFPDLDVQLVPAPRSVSLSQREADIAVMIGRPEKGRLKARRLTDYTLGLYASVSYLERYGEPTSREALYEHALIGYVEDLIYTPELNYNREILRDWRSSIEVSTAIGQFEAVRSGAGIGMLHDFMGSAEASLKRIIPEAALTRSYFLAWHENLGATPRLQAVSSLIGTLVEEERSLFHHA